MLDEVSGRGILTPFQRDKKGDFANGSGEDALIADIEQLIGIIGGNVENAGELPWRTQIGSRLIQLKHRKLRIEKDALSDVAKHLTAGVIRRYESRVRLKSVSTQITDNTLKVTIRFVPIGYNREQVYEANIEV